MNLTIQKNIDRQGVKADLTNDGTEQLVYHTIQVVSGIAVTHGGGAGAGTLLAYPQEIDGNVQTTYLHLKAAETGSAVIKVITHSYDKTAYEAYMQRADDHWADLQDTYTDEQLENADDLGLELNIENPPNHTETVSNEVTLEFDDSRGTIQIV